jgi:magnesium and cobalt transporter
MNNEDPHSAQKSWLSRLLNALHRNAHDRDELIEILYDAKDRQILNNDDLIMIEGVLKVSQTKVRDIMVPRGQMVVVDYDATPEQVVPIIIESTHSRFPVIGENRDEVLGILLAKDLLPYFTEKQIETQSIKSFIRTAVFVPESKRIDVLLREFRINRYHMALVVDEYGGVSGLITIEDVLEQIVGNIEDETDIADDQPNIKESEPGVFDINALTTLDEFNQHFNTNINDDDFDTIGGYVMQLVGHVPKRGEELAIDDFKIIVTGATKRRLESIKLIKQG